ADCGANCRGTRLRPHRVAYFSPSDSRTAAFALRTPRSAYDTRTDPESIFTSNRCPRGTPCQAAATRECRCRAFPRHLLQYFRRALGTPSERVLDYRQPALGP